MIKAGFRAIGIDIKEEYCEITKRLLLQLAEQE